MKRIALTVFLALLLGAPAGAQIGDTPPGDARVREALTELDLEYEIDEDGDFRVVFSFEEDGRSQLAFINSGTETLRLFEIREVWSPAYLAHGPLPEEVANRLLQDSFEKKLGAWQVMPSGDQHAAVFTVKLAAEADPASLLAALEAVLTTADEMEKELLGTDDF